MPFDKGKKRKLIDTCGHDRCYSCMFKNESCTICANEHRHQRQEAQRETSNGKSKRTKSIRSEWNAVRSSFAEFCTLSLIVNDYLCYRGLQMTENEMHFTSPNLTVSPSERIRHVYDEINAPKCRIKCLFCSLEQS